MSTGSEKDHQHLLAKPNASLGQFVKNIRRIFGSSFGKDPSRLEAIAIRLEAIARRPLLPGWRPLFVKKMISVFG